MPDPTPETLQQMMERWRKLAAERNPESPYLSDQLAAYWLAWCAAEIAALVDAAPPTITRAQAEQRLTDQALRDACSIPPDTSDDEITDMRRRLLDALFGEEQPSE